MSSNNIAIQVKGVSKCFEMYEKPHHRLQQMLCMGRRRFYKEFWALKDIGFEVKRGEAVGIIGRNGAGKSTLLQIITGTLEATTGTVEFKGRVAALLELGSGFNPEFTGRENVYMNGAILGLSRKQIEEKYQEIIDFADIGDFIHQPVKTYSSGMKVRLAFAVQVVIEPEILIVDEALAVGDMFFQQKCYHSLKKLQEKGMTLLFVSHSLSTVRSLCERAVYLEKGKVVAVGSAGDVCDQYWNDSTTKGARAKKEAVQKSLSVQKTAKAVMKPLPSIPFRVDEDLGTRATSRTGSRDLEFTAFDIYNSANKKTGFVKFDEQIKIVCSIRANKDIPAGTSCAFSCRTNTTGTLFLVASSTYDFLLPAMKAGQCHTLEIGFKVPMLRGEFFFSTSLKPDQSLDFYYDHIFNAAMVNAVLSPEKKSTGATGLFYVESPKFELVQHQVKK